MEMVTRSFPRSMLTSSMRPSKFSNGPETTLTTSPTLKATLGLASSKPKLLEDRLYFFGPSGIGFVPEPTKPVTPGVLRTTYHESSLITISTRT